MIQKTHGNAFLNSDLKQILVEHGIKSITVGGLVTHGCVKATCLGGLLAGFEVNLLKNSHTYWNKDAESIIMETENELTRKGFIIESLGDFHSDTNQEEILSRMTIAELGQLFPIILEDYSAKWLGLYKLEVASIMGVFPQNEIVRIDHIGSTAIPGLKAKPTIDILLQISERVDIQKLKDAFKSLGYLVNNHPENPAPHLTFVKGYTSQGFKGQPYHVHVRFSGDWNEILFRDYLIKHKTIAQEYESLKRVLAKKFRNDREKYTNSKTEWIEKLITCHENNFW